MYDAVDDNRTRAEHKAWDGIVLRVDDPWWDTHRPPNDFGCRCSVIQLTAEEAERMGKKPKEDRPSKPAGARPAHEGETREYENPRTGEVMQVPRGVGPGWAYNPGKDRLAHLKKIYSEKLREFNNDK
jgi:uncharacterized protein with gpF-like domain